MDGGSRIYVAGGDTLIGSALLKALGAGGYTRVLNRAHREPDLSDPRAVEDFFESAAPEYVFVAAGKSGGIRANERRPAELILDNLKVACHLIECSRRFGTRKLLYLASSCSYPRDCPQPMRVESLMTGSLEPTNEAYAVAKLAGIAMCRAYRRQYGSNFVAVIPANVFGPGDDFSPEESHVVAALMRRMHEAKASGAPSVEVWGTGAPVRDFLFADDLADACLFLMDRCEGADAINVGTGSGLTIREIAEAVRAAVGYPGKLVFDPGKPDGMPVKILDTAPIAAMGWAPRTALADALGRTYEWFRSRSRSPSREASGTAPGSGNEGAW